MASMFYDTLLDQHEYWEDTFKREGIMRLQLPHRNDTDGRLLVHKAKHSIIRSMISRRNTWFPKYGILPSVYGYGALDGGEWTTVADLAMSLEHGAFEYAHGVLENWLEFYVRHDGYRFSEPAQSQSARELVLFAQFYDYTGDPGQLLLKHHLRHIHNYHDQGSGLAEICLSTF
eukprot:SAG25_NODE_620_length_6411_cov_11.541350_4_plen_174_part_00